MRNIIKKLKKILFDMGLYDLWFSYWRRVEEDDDFANGTLPIVVSLGLLFVKLAIMGIIGIIRYIYNLWKPK